MKLFRPALKRFLPTNPFCSIAEYCNCNNSQWTWSHTSYFNWNYFISL